MQFCLSEHTKDMPLLPVFPVRLASLMRYAWWLQDFGVKGGMASIRNYTGALIVWSQAEGWDNPTEVESWLWKRFVKEAPKYIRVYNGSQAKLPVRPEYLKEIVMHTVFDLGNVGHVQELVAYSVLIFTGIRIGHLLPGSFTPKAMQHLLTWENVKFEPNFEDAEIVVFLLDSTKVRSVAKKDPWWTAVGKCLGLPMLCPVMLLKLWFEMSHSGRQEDNVQHLLAPSRFANPPSRELFTRRFRARLTLVAPNLGMDMDAFDASRWSGISFRKGAFSSLAGELQPHKLMLTTDHANIKTTVKHYLSDTIAERAGNTAIISRGFAEKRPEWAEDVQMESVWAMGMGSADEHMDQWKTAYAGSS